MYDENNELNEIDSSFDRVEEFHEVSRYHGWPGFCKVPDSKRVEKRQKVFDTRWQIELKGGRVRRGIRRRILSLARLPKNRAAISCRDLHRIESRGFDPEILSTVLPHTHTCTHISKRSS